MAFKKTFLQLPLNIQMIISIIFIVIATIFLLLFMSESILSTFFDYLLFTKKHYFLDMQQYIIESNILFMNLCLLQYETLIKLFNYQFYSFLKDEYDLMSLSLYNKKQIDESKIVILKYSEIYKIPNNTYNPSLIRDENKKLYVFFYDNKTDPTDYAINLIKTNCFSFSNHINGVGNFRLPFYGNIRILLDFFIYFTK